MPAGIPDFWMVAIRNALEEDAVSSLGSHLNQ